MTYKTTPAPFHTILYEWHSSISRPMPWKETKDPYKIWVSEIILQQTRVEQGIPYYQTFISTFPTVGDLARAPEDKVMSAWQGLGYYSRALNMHAAAKTIMEDYNGIFPDTYEDILSLRGIGPYTAAAIAGFAFNIPHPVLDGNVKRVMARYFGINLPMNSSKGVNEAQKHLRAVFDPGHAAAFNQAIMDFGALICRPSGPACDDCPFKMQCFAFQNQKTNSLPVKNKKIHRSHKTLCAIFASSPDGNFFLKKRDNSGIWKGLYEPLVFEWSSRQMPSTKTLNQFLVSEYRDTFSFNSPPEYRETAKHLLSHQELMIHFYTLSSRLIAHESGFISVPKARLKNFALPVPMTNCLRKLLNG